MSARLSYLVAMRRKPLRMLPHVGAFTRGIASVLVDAHLAACMQDLGVRHAHRLAARGRCVHHRQRHHDPDLGRGQAHAGHRLHGVDHVVPDHADGFGDLCHRRGGAVQAGRAVPFAAGMAATGAAMLWRRDAGFATLAGVAGYWLAL